MALPISNFACYPGCSAPRGPEPSERWSRRARRLLGSLYDDIDFVAIQRSCGVLQFVRRERGDSSFLFASHLVRQCTGIKTKHDDLVRVINGVRAEVSDRTSYDGFGFLRRRGRWVIGCDFRKVGT